VPLQKAVNLEDCSHDRWGLPHDATHTKLEVLSAVHFIAKTWRFITPTTVKKYFVKYGFSIDHVSSNDDSAV
jgi:hypothetical protein